MLTPRATFQKTIFAKGWQDRVDSDQFQAAATAALMEMMLLNSRTDDLATSAAAQKKIEGALMFLNLLMTLTTPMPGLPALPSRQNLERT